MKEYHMTLVEAKRHVKGIRSCINPNEGFMGQLMSYEGILTARYVHIHLLYICIIMHTRGLAAIELYIYIYMLYVSTNCTCMYTCTCLVTLLLSLPDITHAGAATPQHGWTTRSAQCRIPTSSSQWRKRSWKGGTSRGRGG